MRKGKVSQKIIHTIKNSESPLRTIGRDKENELSLKPLLTKKQTASLNRKSTVRSTFEKLQLMNQALQQKQGSTQQTFEGIEGVRST